MSTVAQDLRRSFSAALPRLLSWLSSRVCAWRRPEPLALSEPPNVGDAKFAAIAYYKSGGYERDLAAVASRVSARLAERAPQVSRAALVLDIDDTVLSNWEVIMADDFGRVFDGPCRSLPNGPCGWVAWDLRARTPAIRQMVEVFKQARSLGVAVFFISGRDERQRAATIKNLRAAGFAGYRGLYLEANGARYASAADFKAPRRERIEKDGYTIIANVGDQPSDLGRWSRGNDVPPAQSVLSYPVPFVECAAAFVSWLPAHTRAMARTSRGNRSSMVMRRWVTPWSWA
jgi:hypothetical protein